MELKEIKLEDMEAQSFIEEQCQTISSEVVAIPSRSMRFQEAWIHPS
jgi:hypothetical protein